MGISGISLRNLRVHNRAHLGVHFWVCWIGRNSACKIGKNSYCAPIHSAEYHYPFLERITEIGFDKMMSNAECQKRLFCEMSTKGQEDVDANTVQKAFNYMVLL